MGKLKMQQHKTRFLIFTSKAYLSNGLVQLFVSSRYKNDLKMYSRLSSLVNLGSQNYYFFKVNLKRVHSMYLDRL